MHLVHFIYLTVIFIISNIISSLLSILLHSPYLNVRRVNLASSQGMHFKHPLATCLRVPDHPFNSRTIEKLVDL